MKYTKSARYALYAVVEMATAEGPITVATVARRYGIPEGALAKVLQTLVRAGITQGSRGIGGGYRLARPPSEINVLQVLEVFDPPRESGHCLLTKLSCDQGMACRIRALFDEVDEVARCTFASVSLETLTR